jgi:hypothetical protein
LPPPKPFGKHEYVTDTVAPGPNGLTPSCPDDPIETVVVVLALPALAPTAARAKETDAIASTATRIVATRIRLRSMPSSHRPRPEGLDPTCLVGQS